MSWWSFGPFLLLFGRARGGVVTFILRFCFVAYFNAINTLKMNRLGWLFLIYLGYGTSGLSEVKNGLKKFSPKRVCLRNMRPSIPRLRPC